MFCFESSCFLTFGFPIKCPWRTQTIELSFCVFLLNVNIFFLSGALDDFDKAAAPPPAAAASASAMSGPPLLEDCALFETLFEGEMGNQAREEWERAMTELAQQEPELLEHFQKLSEAAGKVGTDTASQQEFTSCLKDTLKGLAKNADNLQTSGLAGEDLVKALEGLTLEGGSEGGEDANILPIMQSFMQNLLSKEVLYPSLKEITTKYPEWLDANKPTLSSDDFQRYEQQAKIMADICKLFEKEEEEGAEDKERTFETIMDLMQKRSDEMFPSVFPQPPGLNFDMDSLNLPGGPAGGPDQCSVM
uniref:Peroxisomal biogenesis factor 19 n=1 Tax=Periophthalmus magnuspinnatus TaxID=409849 RepID=A0A3B4A4C0_9GOBI